jgi:hypothetical protein
MTDGVEAKIPEPESKKLTLGLLRAGRILNAHDIALDFRGDEYCARDKQLMKDKDATNMAIALQFNTTLENLSLANNEIGDQGAKAFCVCLRDHNLVLKNLFLDGNQVTQTALLAKIEEYLDRNRRMTLDVKIALYKLNNQPERKRELLAQWSRDHPRSGAPKMFSVDIELSLRQLGLQERPKPQPSPSIINIINNISGPPSGSGQQGGSTVIEAEMKKMGDQLKVNNKQVADMNRILESDRAARDQKITADFMGPELVDRDLAGDGKREFEEAFFESRNDSGLSASMPKDSAPSPATGQPSGGTPSVGGA